ncbi:MAG: hypothetical protein HY551_00245 [Elusimicrobia bacterium]|nr:hypothetical protein [Elusimicrobiota bacterium]
MMVLETAQFEETIQERREPARRHGTAPPKRGLCRRCGQDRPINRLMLCYSCWVKTQLEERADWREGMPHPDWCGCALPEHDRRCAGN